MIRRIHKIEDVAVFVHNLIEEGLNMHPDEDFTNYINLETNESTYSIQEAELRNNLMNESFKICKSAGVDIYDFTQEIYLKETGLDKYIPLPSSGI